MQKIRVRLGSYCKVCKKKTRYILVGNFGHPLNEPLYECQECKSFVKLSGLEKIETKK